MVNKGYPHVLLDIASHQSADYIRERLRLLYVGITRARTDLVITWNTGRMGNLQPAVPFLELARLWEAYPRETTG